MTEIDITERIARAIDAVMAYDEQRPPYWLSPHQRDKRNGQIYARRLARAVIEDLASIPVDKLISGEYVAVPVEPTEEMDTAGLDDPRAGYCDFCMQSGYTRNSGWPTIIWRAMLAAHKEQQ